MSQVKVREDRASGVIVTKAKMASPAAKKATVRRATSRVRTRTSALKAIR